MCSANCPCEDLDIKSEWTSLSADELLQQYGRVAPFVFKTPGEDIFTVKTYEECIINYKQNPDISTDFKAFAEGWGLSLGYKGEVDYLKFFEQEYDCSGICETALFSFSRSIEEGKPSSCFDEVKKKVKD